MSCIRIFRTTTLLISLVFFQQNLFAQKKDESKSRTEYGPKSIRFSEKQKTKPSSYSKALKLEKDFAIKNKKQSKKDKLGYNHSRYQQTYKGLDILGAEYIFHSKNDILKSANGRIVQKLDLDIQASINQKEALEIALDKIDAQEYAWQNQGMETLLQKNTHSKEASHYPKGKLIISSKNYDKVEPLTLAFQFEIYSTQPVGRYNVEVDAKSGEVINFYNKIHTITGSGQSLYDGDVTLETFEDSGNYFLVDEIRGSGINTFDLQNGTDYGSATVFSESDNYFNETNSLAGVSAHFGAAATYDYFSQAFGRDSYDDNGAAINSYVHYSSGYFNAFWDGYRMTYGDGDGVSATALVCLDIVGHEIGHAVTEHSAGLVYSYESGALNESFSDIFGQSIEFTNFPETASWNLADQIYTDGESMIRSMSDPNSQGQPDTYLGDQWYSGGGDNGGVHYNSGVQNFWYYLLVEGVSGTNDFGYSFDVPSIGLEAAQQIAYRNLTVYLTATSQYMDARAGAESAAVDLYGAGSFEHLAVIEAWNAVGVPTTEPMLSVVSEIDFSNTPIGLEKSLNVNFSNTGTGLLIVHDITIDNPDFDVENTSFNIGQSETIGIDFFYAPGEAGESSSIATVMTNADTIEINLYGIGVLPPVMTVSIDTLYDDLYTGTTNTQTFTIDNNEGESDLYWSTKIDFFDVDEVPEITQQAPIGFYSTRLNTKVNQSIKSLSSPIPVPVNRSIDAEQLAIIENLPSGIAGFYTLGETLLIVNYQNSTLEFYDLISNEITSNFSIHPEPFGVTYAEGLIWIGDINGIVRGYSTEGELLASFDSPISDFNAITFDGNRFLLTSIFNQSNIFAVDFDGSILEEITNPSINISALEWNSNKLWLLDGRNLTPTIYRTSIEDQALIIEDNINIEQSIEYSYALSHYYNDLLWADYTGFGYILDDNFSNYPEWLNFDLNEGFIAAGETQEITALFDANQMTGGLYYADVQFITNDPINVLTTITASFQVTGAPNISLEIDTIRVDDTFVDYTNEYVLNISNNGTDSLGVTSLEIDNPLFTIDTLSFGIEANENFELTISYLPVEASQDTTLLVIRSNDADQDSLGIIIIANSIYPPIIAISEYSMEENLFSGETSSQTLSIENQGQSILEGFINFNLVEINEESLLDIHQKIDFNEMQIISERIHQKTKYLSLNQGIVGIYSDDVENGIKNWTTETYDIDDLWHITNSNSSEGEFSFWCGDINTGTYETGNTISNALISPEIDFSILNSDSLFLIFDESYETESGWDYCMVDITIDNGVSWVPLRGSRGSAPSGSSGGWINTVLDIQSYQGETIKFRFLFETGDAVSNDFPGWFVDNIKVSTSVNGFTWLDISENSFSIESGGNIDVDILFDANNLYGGLYQGMINIESNDPETPLLEIPIELEVTGIGDIDLSQDTILYDSPSYVGYTYSKTLDISNLGTDSLGITSIEVSNPIFEVDTLSLGLEPNESHTITINYSPIEVNADSVWMTIWSDDFDEDSVSVLLVGDSYYPPIIGTSTDSIGVDMLVDETSIQTITIDNYDGGSSLMWQIEIEHHSSTNNNIKATSDQNALIQIPISENGVTSTGSEWVEVNKIYENNISNDFIDLTPEGSIIEGSSPVLANKGYKFSVQEEFSISAAEWWIDLPENSFIRASVYNEQGVLLLRGDTVFGNGLGEHWYKSPIDFIFEENNSYVLSFYCSESSTAIFDRIDNVGYGPFLIEDLLLNIYSLSSGSSIGEEYPSNLNSWCPIQRMVVNDSKWLSSDIYSGTLDAGGIENIDFTFNTENLYGGLYEATISIESNDPASPLINIPVGLEVTGVGDIDLSQDTILYEPIMYVGYIYIDSLIISNVGTDSLGITSIEVDHPLFTVDTLSLGLEPEEELILSISYSPTEVSLDSAWLIIRSDDVDEDSLAVLLVAQAFNPPVIGSSADSIGISLYTDELSTQIITIDNSAGGSDLFVTSSVSNKINETVSFPSNYISSQEYSNQIPVMNSHSNTIDYGDKSVLIIQDNDAWGLYMAEFLWDEFSVPSEIINSDMINILDLESYDLIITCGGQSSNYYTNISNNKTLFEEYVFNGGVLQIQGATQGSNISLVGDVEMIYGNQEYENIFISDHPITEGLSNPIIGYYVNHNVINNLPANALTLIETQNSQIPTTAIYPYGNGTVVCSGMTLELLYLYEPLSRQVLINITEFNLSNTGLNWISLGTTTDTIPAGQSVDLEVLFNATDLDGGLYEGFISIESNDPASSLIAIPVGLEVIPIGDIDTDIDALDFDLVYQGFDKNLALEIANVGNEVLNISNITFSNSEFSTETTSFEIETGSSISLIVNFAPQFVSNFESIMTIISNDFDEGEKQITLEGQSLNAPVIVLDPTQIERDLYIGDTETVDIVISNLDGGSDLNWELEMYNSQILLNTESNNKTVNSFKQINKGMIDNRIGQPVNSAHGGPDLFGYSWTDSDHANGPVFEWNDISSSGVNITSNLNDDNVAGPYPLGFEFDFYGETYSQFYVSSNGFISFENTSNGCCSGQPVPNQDDANNIIAWAWRDGYPYGSTHYENFENKTIIQFTNYGVCCNESSASATAEIIIYSNGKIKLNYLNLEGAYLDGNQSIGIENWDGSDGLQVAFNTDYLHNNLAVEFESSGNSWVSSNIQTGTIPAGQEETIQLTIDATNLDKGSYQQDLVINNNDPLNGQLILPVSINVAGTPEISLSQSNLNFGHIYPTTSGSLPLSILNSGTEVLNIESISSSNDSFVFESIPNVIGENEEYILNIIFDQDELGTQTGIITITSDDLDEGTVEVNLEGLVVTPPSINVANTSYSTSLRYDEAKYETLTIHNSGQDTLIWSSDVFSNIETEWITLVDTGGIIYPGDTMVTHFQIDALDIEIGEHYAEIILTSNDPNTSEVVIDLSIEIKDDPILEIDTSDIFLSTIDTTFSLELLSNVELSTITTQGWISALVDEESLYISVEENITTVTRSGIIHLSGEDIEVSIQVFQEASDSLFIQLEQDSLEVSSIAGELSVALSSNTSQLEVVSYSDWLTVELDEENVKLYYENNISYSERTGSIRVFGDGIESLISVS
ncbi:MAG: M4 family metallopeptidase, partial [Reichenbachiella sp.]